MKVKCFLCRSVKTQLYFNNAKLLYHKTFFLCDECGYVFAFPRIPEKECLAYYYGEYAKNAYALEENEESIDKTIAWRFKSAQAKIAFFSSFFPKNGTVLELGSGLGTFLMEMQKQFGSKVRGVEISPIFIKISRERFGLDVYCGDIRDFFTNDVGNKYDVIIMDQVLEHLYEPLNVLRLVKSKLSLSGLLYIGVPNLASPAHSKEEFFIPEHVSSFIPAVLAHIAGASGFRIVKAALPNFSSMHFLLTHADSKKIAGEDSYSFPILSRTDIDSGFMQRELNEKISND